MDFLDKFVLPQSAEHLTLLHYILVLTMFLFIPYISAVTGGLIISLVNKRKGLDDCKSNCLVFAKDIIDKVLINKSSAIVLGILPLKAAILVYLQIQSGSGSPAVIYLSVALLFIIAGLIAAFTYKYSLDFNDLLSHVKVSDNIEAEEKAKNYINGTSRLSSKSGIYAIVFLLFGLYFFAAGTAVASLPNTWNDSMLVNLAMFETFLRYLILISFSLSLSGGAILFATYYWEKKRVDINHSYSHFVKETAVKYAFYPALAIPILTLISVLRLPKDSLTGSVFTFFTIGMVLLFIALQFIYGLVRDNNHKYTGAFFFFLVFAVMAFVVKDQAVLFSASQKNYVVLSDKFEKYLTELRGTDAIAEISGKEIFDVRCASCHKFDAKLVGPPYKETLPKYEGKEDQLTNFILNPVKVNPAFPPMPNPGLKASEAKAVAKYLLEEYKKQ